MTAPTEAEIIERVIAAACALRNAMPGETTEAWAEAIRKKVKPNGTS